MKTYKKLVCSYCNKPFLKYMVLYEHSKKRGDKHSFCSPECVGKFQQKKIIKPCKQCGKLVEKIPSHAKKIPNFFCNKSCAATYNNNHKTKGTRRSKLEKYLEEQLSLRFPDLLILYNDKQTIKSELDFYIPSLSLAFELNGIFHYEPIFGKHKLASIQNNDARKMQACLELEIELCTIDSSQLSYFKPKKAQKYFDIIKSIIQQKLDSVSDR